MNHYHVAVGIRITGTLRYMAPVAVGITIVVAAKILVGLFIDYCWIIVGATRAAGPEVAGKGMERRGGKQRGPKTNTVLSSWLAMVSCSEIDIIYTQIIHIYI
jgi:hypothetical protein